jgi:hypothetical protein
MVQSDTQSGFVNPNAQFNISPVAQGIRIMEAPAHTGYANDLEALSNDIDALFLREKLGLDMNLKVVEHA